MNKNLLNTKSRTTESPGFLANLISGNRGKLAALFGVGVSVAAGVFSLSSDKTTETDSTAAPNKITTVDPNAKLVKIATPPQSLSDFTDVHSGDQAESEDQTELDGPPTTDLREQKRQALGDTICSLFPHLKDDEATCNEIIDLTEQGCIDFESLDGQRLTLKKPEDENGECETIDLGETPPLEQVITNLDYSDLLSEIDNLQDNEDFVASGLLDYIKQFVSIIQQVQDAVLIDDPDKRNQILHQASGNIGAFPHMDTEQIEKLIQIFEQNPAIESFYLNSFGLDFLINLLNQYKYRGVDY